MHDIPEGGFRWNDYAKNKAVDIAVHYVTQGISSKLPGASKLGSNLTLKEALAQKIITKEVFNETKDRLIKEAIIRTVVSSTINIGLSNVTKSIVKDHQNDIIGNIEKKIFYLFDNSPTKENFSRIIAVDQFIGIATNQSYLRRLIRD